ncbi:MAG: hypothetical protein DRP59_05490 [Spirochaetes bacterium]|nr:MAG: hypothetical protein DRP59_05490 [Spirochaetota bacterium]
MRSLKNFWYELSIKRKLMIFFSIIILLISLLNLYTLVNAFRYLKIYELDLIKNTLIHDLNNALTENNNALENYLLYSSESYHDVFQNSIPAVWEKWDKVWKICNTSNDIYFQLSAIRYAFIAYVNSATKAIQHKDYNDKDFVDTIFYIRRIRSYIDSYLKNLVQLRLEEGSKLHSVQISKVKVVRIVSFAGTILFGIVSLFFLNLFANSLSRPIRRLASMSLKVAGGELNIPAYKVSSRDEVGILTDSFNTMTSNLEKMVNRLKDKVVIERKLREDELKIAQMSHSLKEAQFLSLQSQISPHFLFNTLNTISRTSLFEKAPKTVDLIEALSSILRYTLNKQNKFVTLEEEISILVRYMQIQKTRYGDRLSFILNRCGCEDSVEIPIFTIQPLVENAVKYGIEPREEGGVISVSVGREGDSVVIEVKDTGAGMSAEILDKLKYKGDVETTSSSSGIGLKNVQHRLSIAYQGEAYFNIKSRLGGGTTISIKIPWRNDV